uniref:Uncharacterized protein n=2 Tax=albitarsis series TaxID=58233 RepID=A0A2M3ZLF8_9DIPT
MMPFSLGKRSAATTGMLSTTITFSTPSLSHGFCFKKSANSSSSVTSSTNPSGSSKLGSSEYSWSSSLL